MFWRRRKLPEEDDPLIPRGLIWQATAEENEQASVELPPVMPENSPNDSANIPPTQLPEQWSTEPLQAPQFRKQPSDLPAAPNDLSSAPAWPRLDDAEVARRSRSIDTAVSFPHRGTHLSSPVPKPVEPVREPLGGPFPLKPSLLASSQTTPPQETEWDEFESADAEPVEPQSVGAPADWHPKESGVAEVERPSVLARLRISTAKSASVATAKFEDLRQASSFAFAETKTKLKDSSKLAVLRSRARMQRMSERAKAVRIDVTPATAALQRIRSTKVKVRIPASNLRVMAALKHNAKAVQDRVRRTLQPNERLWTSMAMAALSALLALGVVAGLRRYDPTYSASETVSASTAPRATQLGSVAPVKAAVARAPIQRPSPVVATRFGVENAVLKNPVVPSQRTAVAKTAPAAKPKPRIRHSEDDDYVAADTYVRYGSNGKRSR